METVQVDSCLTFEQIDTLYISVGGQEGGLGGWVVILGTRPKILNITVRNFCLTGFCSTYPFFIRRRQNTDKAPPPFLFHTAYMPYSIIPIIIQYH